MLALGLERWLSVWPPWKDGERIARRARELRMFGRLEMLLQNTQPAVIHLAYRLHDLHSCLLCLCYRELEFR